MLKHLSINSTPLISLLPANSSHLTVGRVHNAGEQFPELGQVSEACWQLVDKQNLQRSYIYIDVILSSLHITTKHKMQI